MTYTGHSGTDFILPIGTPIRAMASGVVKKIHTDARGGLTVFVDHGGGIATSYRHLQTVSQNCEAILQRGQVIGLSGNSGLIRWSSGLIPPHLHITLWVNGLPTDPYRPLNQSDTVSYWIKDNEPHFPSPNDTHWDFTGLWLLKSRQEVAQYLSVHHSTAWVNFSQYFWRLVPKQLSVEEVFNLPETQQNSDKLKIPDVVLFDRDSRSEYGLVSNEISRGNLIITELEARKIKVVGLFKLGTSFGNDGNLITSDINFWRIFKNRKRGLIDIGFIKLSSEGDTSQIVDYLKQYLPRGVRVLLMKEFMNFEKNYWKKSTAIGFIFTLSTTMAFIVGTIIVYQILYSDVSAHLAEYATLKAIGYTDFYLIKAILQEALILAILGYIPSLAFTFCLYDLTKRATLLPIEMNVIRALLVLFLTVIMCSFAGLISINKLRNADPSNIF